MNKYLCITIVGLSFIFMSCAGNLEVTRDFTPPTIKEQPRMLYPKSAQEKSYTGDSKVVIVISETGTVNKVDVVESSGFDVLDEAAVEYCKGLLFYPAQRYGKPVYSRMEMEIKFDLSEPVWSAKYYVYAVKDCYVRLVELNQFAGNNINVKRNEIENEILNWHNEFVQNMTDVVNFNFYVGQVISPELSAEWKNDWNTWPLSFLLYHDFIQRFQDYDSLAEVKIRLRNSLKEDIQYIENNIVEGANAQIGKAKLLIRIKRFMDDNYPDVSTEPYLKLESGPGYFNKILISRVL